MLGHWARLADAFLAEPTNCVGVPRVPLNREKQFFKQNPQLRSLATGEMFKRPVQYRPAVSQQFSSAFLTRGGQMKGNDASVTRRPSGD